MWYVPKERFSKIDNFPNSDGMVPERLLCANIAKIDACKKQIKCVHLTMTEEQERNAVQITYQGQDLSFLPENSVHLAKCLRYCFLEQK